jgi:periplasmic protein TonB
MSPALPYREETRTPLAFSLSVLLHGLAAAAVVVFLWSHPAPPPPPPMVFELEAGPASDASAADAPATPDQSSLPDVASPAFAKLPPTPDATSPAQPQTQPQPAPVVKPAAAPVKTVTPIPAQNGRLAPKPAPKPPSNTTNTTDLATWEKNHPAANPASATTTAAHRGTAPKVGIDVNSIANLSNNQGTRGENQAAASPGTSDDYIKRIAARLKAAFSLPGGVSGLSENVRLTIAADGKVVEAVPLGSSGNDQFDAAVRAALDSVTQVEPPPGGREVTYTFIYMPEP